MSADALMIGDLGVLLTFACRSAPLREGAAVECGAARGADRAAIADRPGRPYPVGGGEHDADAERAAGGRKSLRPLAAVDRAHRVLDLALGIFERALRLIDRVADHRRRRLAGSAAPGGGSSAGGGSPPSPGRASPGSADRSPGRWRDRRCAGSAPHPSSRAPRRRWRGPVAAMQSADGGGRSPAPDWAAPARRRRASARRVALDRAAAGALEGGSVHLRIAAVAEEFVAVADIGLADQLAAAQRQ